MNEILELQKLESTEDVEMAKGKSTLLTILGGGSTISIQC